MSWFRLIAWAFVAFPAIAQLSPVAPGPFSPTPALPGQPRFELSTNGGGPASKLRSGYSVSSHIPLGAFVAHRDFYDPSAHTYFGYDLVVQPDHDDFYRISFYDLSITPFDFAGGLPESLDPTLWKKLPIPALPPSRVVEAGDVTSIGVYSDPATGAFYTDSVVIIAPTQSILQRQNQIRAQVQRFQALRGVSALPAARPTPTVSGPTRDFAVADAEIRLQQPRVSINDAAVDRPVRGNASGSLIWVYLPGHGRFILSIVARPDLGFTKAGELRGGAATFTLGPDNVRIESPVAIATGESAYSLYVLHDPDWAPTSASQVDSIHIGSVSPRELALLKK